ncbi:MAG: hypothetical protein AABZ64_02130 [Nitrospinota bacterium]
MFRLWFTGFCATALGIALLVISFFTAEQDALTFKAIGANLFIMGGICLAVWFFIRRRRS